MKNKNPSINRILVVRTDRIGDVVLSLPVASALRKTYPRAHLAMLVNPVVRDLASDQPDIDAVLFDGSETGGCAGFFRLVRQIRNEKFDAALLLHPTLRLALLLFLAGIQIRVGTGYRVYSFLFNRKVWEHRKHSFKHEAEYNLSLAEKLGVRSGPVVFHIPLRKPAEEKVSAFLREKKMGGCRLLVVLHPGSRGSALDWPLESFVRLAGKMVKEAGACIVVTGGDEDKEIADRIVQVSPDQIASTAGRFNLRELCALLGRADLFISNSTGPLHLARAMNREVIGFYPPLISASPRRWGPYGAPDSVLMPNLPECRKCRGKGCAEWNCMNTISVDETWRMVCKKTQGKRV